ITAISRELADTLGISLQESLGVAGVGGAIEAQPTLLRSVALGGMSAAEVPCVVLDFDDIRTGIGLDIEGILGFSALNRYAVTFDFDRGTLSLGRSEPGGRLPPGSARVPFQVVAGQVVVAARVDGGAPVRFVVDTG